MRKKEKKIMKQLHDPLIPSIDMTLPSENPVTQSTHQKNDNPKEMNTFWIRITALGKLPCFFSDAYWIALMIDLFSDSKPEIIGISQAGLALGTIVSLYTTISAMSCEYIVNKASQNTKALRPKSKTSNAQLVALFGYWLDQACDRASGAGLALHLAGADTLDRSTRIYMQTFTLAFGLLSSIAETYTAKAISSGDGSQASNSRGLRFFIYVSAAGKLLGFLGAIYWPGLLIDTLLNLNPKIAELSIPALIIGSLISAYITIAGVYCGFKINHSTLSEAPEHEDLSKVNLPLSQKIFLYGYFLDQIADQAAACVIIAHIIEGDHDWSQLTHLSVQAGATLFGGVTSIGYIATARNILKRSM
jgi:hypothetical protein